MKRFYSNKYVWFAVALFVILGGIAYAALVRPNTLHNLDYFGSEPFKSQAVMRSSLILTNSYVATDVIDIKQGSAIQLMFDVTKGSLTSFQYKVYMSYDNNNWFLEATETVAASTITDSEANYTIALSGNVKYFKIIPAYGTYIKLEVKGTGTVTGNLCAVYIMGVL